MKVENSSSLTILCAGLAGLCEAAGFRETIVLVPFLAVFGIAAGLEFLISARRPKVLWRRVAVVVSLAVCALLIVQRVSWFAWV